MNKLYLVCTFLVILFVSADTYYYDQPIKIDYPESWPSPTYDFDSNPLTKAGVDLGRKIFYDPLLSKDCTVSCANCHLSYSAFTHVDHRLSHGIGDSIGNRNSLALMNLAWNKSFMWDGSVHNLDMQALAPITDPKEMGNSLDIVIQRLKDSDYYSTEFNNIFGDEVTVPKLLKVLAQFQLTLISANSKYDQVMRGDTAFTVKEESGYKLFLKHCNHCHTEPLFTNGDFANNGLTPDPLLMDLGRYSITKDPQDSFKFRVPTLRNISYSKPYMHDGRFRSLKSVINHYTLQNVNATTIDTTLKMGIYLSKKERIDLLAFLLTLSDKEFVFNQEFAFPKG